MNLTRVPEVRVAAVSPPYAEFVRAVARGREAVTPDEIWGAARQVEAVYQRADRSLFGVSAVGLHIEPPSSAQLPHEEALRRAARFLGLGGDGVIDRREEARAVREVDPAMKQTLIAAFAYAHSGG